LSCERITAHRTTIIRNASGAGNAVYRGLARTDEEVRLMTKGSIPRGETPI
jgi:hypothetical protein